MFASRFQLEDIFGHYSSSPYNYFLRKLLANFNIYQSGDQQKNFSFGCKYMGKPLHTERFFKEDKLRNVYSKTWIIKNSIEPRN